MIIPGNKEGLERLGNPARMRNLYKTSPNVLGITGYNLPRLTDLLKRRPTSQVIRRIFTDSDVDLAKLPLRMNSEYRDEDLQTIAKASVAHTLQLFGFNLSNLKFLTLNLWMRTIEVHDQSTGATFDTFESFDPKDFSINLGNYLIYTQYKHRVQTFESYYNIPRSVDTSYLVSYLAAHCATHAIQAVQKRLTIIDASKFTHKSQGELTLGADSYLGLKTEMEAHNSGVLVADNIFEACFTNN